jgi:hypothetical protein
MLGLFAVLAILGTPVVIWLARRDPATGWFAGYGLLLSALPFDPSDARRLLLATVVTGLWWLLFRRPEMRRWTLCGFFAYLPDLIKHFLDPLMVVHEFFHNDPSVGLADWISLLVRGRWKIEINDRIFDPWYQVGYGLEILLEGSILFTSLYLLTRRTRPAGLAPVHDQNRPVHERSLVG